MRPWKAALSHRRMEGLRWAFGCGSWRPTRSEWLLAARCVQAEERARIGAFVFARDAKAAMGGRLLIRKLIAEKLKIPWNEIQLARTTKGKPYLVNPVLTTIPNFNFNISHHGDYAVLAAEPNLQVGVDIVKTDFPGSSSVAEFFRIMNRQFTDYEWKTIKMAGDEWAQLDMFYRHWALKESFIKAIGIGVGFNLQRIEFHASPLHMQTGQVSKETMMFLDGDQEEAWTFEVGKTLVNYCKLLLRAEEAFAASQFDLTTCYQGMVEGAGLCKDQKETILDDNHHVAVALGKPDMFGKYALQVQEDISQEAPQFTLLSFKDLISSAIAMAPEDHVHWENFQAKHKKASRQHRMPV